MGGITAIYNLDGRPVDRELFSRMHGATAYRAVDGSGEWLSDAVALGYHAFHTTPEAVNEHQPLRDNARGLVLLFDGRIDNREELAAAIRERGNRPRDDTDAELALCAYQSWGEDAPRQIVGDFALVIWDEAKQSLFCARDHVGIKPLFYYHDDHTFVCVTEMHQLFTAPFVSRDIDVDTVGVFLTGNLVDGERTLYRHIRRLEAAHCLTVSRGRLSVRRFFDIDPSRRIRYRDDDEYAEHFRELFAEAVRCRLRTPNGLAAIQMSGGVDSTSVAGMARSLLAAGALGETRVETFSLIFPGMRADEQQFIRESTAMFGLPATLVKAAVMEPAGLAEAILRYRDPIEVPNGAMWTPLWGIERERGFRVALTGAGSDEYMTGYGDAPANLIAQMKLGELIRYMGSPEQRLWQEAESRNAFTYLLRHGIWPLLPFKLQFLLKRASGARLYPEFVNHDFARRLNLAVRLRRKPRHPRGMSIADQSAYQWYAGVWLSHSMEYLDRLTGRAGIEERQPFHDRRLVEFLFAIPAEQRCRNGMIKFILRNAMRGLIPELIRTRPDKAGYGDIFLAVLRNFNRPALESMALEQAGWIDSRAFCRMFDEVLEPRDDDPAGLWPVWSTLSMEFWYKLVILGQGNPTAQQTY
ncbi:MAG TPA: asparagine synthase-related protein [Candidatus Binataceae bacterium]|nr:asparagine synthase-related protein [Candidatus Binataceae bacterium]